MRFLADQNFNGRILRGFKERHPEFDCVRTQDFGLGDFSDPELLTWAADESRVVLTHDARTFPQFAYERMASGEKMSGVIVVDDQMPIGKAIEDLEIVVFCNLENEWENNVTRIPL